MTPSKNWRENIPADEEQRFEAYADQMVEMQKSRNAKYGPGRGLHRKQVLALRGTVEILADLPEYAKHGLFARPGNYEARVRLSNGSMENLSDKKPDIRGFALKILGVTGDGALGFPIDSQDFLLINRTVFGFAQPDFFMGLLHSLKKGPHAVLGYHIRELGFFPGIRAMGKLVKGQLAKFTGFGTEKFHTAAPVACGPYACRLRLLPAATRAALPPPAEHWRDDLKAHLSKGPLVYELQLQFFVDEKITPIEDGSVDWPEDQSPYVTVGRLTIPEQSFDDAAAQKLADESEKGKFDPWNALLEHRPLGAIMRVRKTTYFKSQQARGAA